MDLSGSLLIAMPSMADPRFERSLVLICAHSSDGAMGLVVNKPVNDLSFAGMLEQLNIPLARNGRDIRVHLGGPMERGRGFVLHTPDYMSVGATMLVSGKFGMTATVDILEALARGQGPSSAIMALGYSGWGPGQLEAEVQRNDWLTAEAPSDLVFSDDDPGKWTSMLRHMGIDPLTLSPTAGHA
ncbi:YqgE/AlgH family protein [Rhodobacter sp. NSM]|uniref:YqgE/AlgH family protein n=1 Tax=Rhodobacter sp. NSM TaxID=3457501 RepID=UPI003FD35A3E